MTQEAQAAVPIITIEQAGAHAGGAVTIRGWIYNLRESGKLLFPIFRDGTGIIAVPDRDTALSGDERSNGDGPWPRSESGCALTLPRLAVSISEAFACHQRALQMEFSHAPKPR